MIKYQKKRKTYKVIVGVTCDKCKQECPPHSDYMTLAGVGGYGSKFGDMNYWEVDLCDSCFYEMVKDVVRYRED